MVERIVERIGFLGILLCASIPNPFFDLAGITCGHFLVPFGTFFAATIVGKAIVKTHLQVGEVGRALRMIPFVDAGCNRYVLRTTCGTCD